MPLKHYDSAETAILTTHASTKGLGTTLWQNERIGKDSKELEQLAAVSGGEYFKHNLLGRKFRFETDHEALVSVFNRDRRSREYSTRSIRGRHRLLSYEFEVFKRAGEKRWRRWRNVPDDACKWFEQHEKSPNERKDVLKYRKKLIKTHNKGVETKKTESKNRSRETRRKHKTKIDKIINKCFGGLVANKILANSFNASTVQFVWPVQRFKLQK